MFKYKGDISYSKSRIFLSSLLYLSIYNPLILFLQRTLFNTDGEQGFGTKSREGKVLESKYVLGKGTEKLSTFLHTNPDMGD